MNFITASIIGFFALVSVILFGVLGVSLFPSIVIALIITAFATSTLLRFKDNLLNSK